MTLKPTAQAERTQGRTLPGRLWAYLGVLAVITVVVRTELSEKMLDSKYTLFRVPLDFLVYRKGGALVQHGQDVYTGGLIGKLPFTYPPFSAWLFSALSHVPAEVGAMLWQFCLFLLLIVVIIAIIAERGYRVTGRTAFFGVLLALASLVLVPIREGFFFGQINLLLLALIAADVLRSPANRRRSDIGIATGIAAGIKLVPAFFWLVFIIRRQWWALARSVAAFLVTVGIGFLFVQDAGTYWSEKFLDSSRVGEAANPGAQSLNAVLQRAFSIDNKLVWLLGCAIILSLTVAVLWRANQRDNRTAELGFAGVALVMVSPFSWMHHWVWVVPVLLCVADALVTWLPHWWGTLVAAAAVAVLSVPFLTMFIAPSLALSKQQHWPGIFAMGYVLWGLVMLVLAAAALWRPALTGRRGRAGSGEPEREAGDPAAGAGEAEPDVAAEKDSAVPPAAS